MLKKLKPTTPGSRFTIKRSFEDLDGDINPYKKLIVPLKSHGGRNNRGRITVRHQGGGVKRNYRLIDFKRNDKDGINGTVTGIQYDPNRSADIALITYADGEKRYIICPDTLKVNDVICAGLDIAPKVGNCLPISNIPLGTKVCCVELKPGKGAQLARSAGNYATVVNYSDNNKYMLVRLSSGEDRFILATCRATIGEVSNKQNKLIKLGKAGASRKLGIRPTVRGRAMNPVDHPMGGGEGKGRGQKIPRSPWGQKSKGFKTRNNKKSSSKFILSNKKKNR